MTKIIKRIFCSVLLVLVSFNFVACSFGDSNDDTTPKNYVIQYTDDKGTSYQLEVTENMPYTIEVIPEKTGYDFLGYFDAEVGGTQYTSSSGSSLATFTDGKNIILYPQFKAKEYTLILDYQGAAVTGSRQLSVSYNSQVPELPKNLTLDHKVFSGWYTEPNCGGTQISDEYGLLPIVSIVNENNFDITNENGYIYLYAGFEVETFTVTFHYGNSINSEEIEVPYNTPVSEIVTETRNDNGFAVLSWSKYSDLSSEFTGKITDTTILYAKEWAPCINFDTNGGEKVNAVVAKAGASITLPTASKDLAKFMYWETTAGNQAEVTKMPYSSTTLKAVWQGKLVFDENGGEEVNDISKPAGETISLPTPTRDGYIFAGWYTDEKQEYTTTTMPTTGVNLKAGWYKVKTEKVVISSDSSYTKSKVIGQNNPYGPTANWREEVDLSKYISSTGSTTISIDIYYDTKNSSTFTGKAGLYLYDGDVVSDANCLGKIVNDHASNSWKTFNNKAEFTMNGSTLYLCYYGNRTSSGYYDSYVYFKNVWMNLTYPDTGYLYL